MKKNIINPEIDRRSFIKLASVAGVGSMVLPLKTWSRGATRNSRIVSVTDDLATNGLNIDEVVAQTMMDCGIMELAQIWDIGNAWKSLLPGISTNKIIAIKVNCAAPNLPSHPVVTEAITSSLIKMQFGDSYFPENNIIIFERSDYELINAGFTINDSATGVRCFGTNHSGVGFSSHYYTVNGQNKKISRIVSDMADYIINLSVLKNHSLSGVTLCLKNHYGTVQDAITMHSNYCDPWIPALNAIDPIINKSCVNIVDGLFGIKSGGPGGNPQFAANNFIMSTDIVATDFLGSELLRENGCTTTNLATHIATAVTYGLGTNQPSQMDIVEIINPTLMNVLVNQPNGGESLIPDIIYNIQWESTNLTNVKIEYSTNDGLDWINIIDSIAANTGHYNWTVPNTPSENCKLRISCIDNPYINDISDSIFTIQSSAPVIQSFALNTGFQFISSYVVEGDMNMLIVLEDILNENLVYVRDSDGNMLRKIGPNWINGIGDWVSTEGYLFKLLASESFVMEGNQFPTSTPISLPTGFRFVSFLPTSSIDAMTAFATIIGDDLVYIRNSDGNMLRKIGPNWINGIGDAIPGEGYLVKMLNPGVLIYPSDYTKSSVNSNNSKTTHFNFNGGNAADPVYTIYVNGLEIGDEVAAYDGDVLVGAIKISSKNKLLNALPVFSTLTDRQGHVYGNPINLKIYNSNSNEISDADFTMENIYNSYVENVYPAEDGKYSIVNITKGSINDATKSLSIYPNPVQTKTVISFNLISEANTHVWISDIHGKKISILNKSKLSVGDHQFTFDARNLTTGTYLCNFEFKNQHIVKKLIKK